MYSTRSVLTLPTYVLCLLSSVGNLYQCLDRGWNSLKQIGQFLIQWSRIRTQNQIQWRVFCWLIALSNVIAWQDEVWAVLNRRLPRIHPHSGPDFAGGEIWWFESYVYCQNLCLNSRIVWWSVWAASNVVHTYVRSYTNLDRSSQCCSKEQNGKLVEFWSRTLAATSQRHPRAENGEFPRMASRGLASRYLVLVKKKLNIIEDTREPLDTYIQMFELHEDFES